MKVTDFRGQALQNVMPQKMDLIDRKIMFLLSENCRTSNTALAKALRIKREVVAYRINQLLRKKLITGFFTLIDPRKLGFMVFQVYIKLVKTVGEETIVQDLVDKMEVTVLSACSGRFDLFFFASTRTLEEFESFMSRFLLNHSSFIREYVILNSLRNEAMGNTVLLADLPQQKPLIAEVKGSAFNQEFRQRNRHKRIVLDKADRKIVGLLQLNARMTLREIAAATGITPGTAKSRMSQLISTGTIQHFTSIISFASLGYQWFMLFLNVAGVEESRFRMYLQQHPNIEWCVRSVGVWNYKISIFAKDNREFHGVINDIRNKFKENIMHFDSIIIFNQFKFRQRVE